MAVRRPAHSADLVPPTIPFFSPERAPHKGHIGYEGSPGDGYAAGIGMLSPIMFITLRIVQGLGASLPGG
jgi:hypothetical protein